MDLHEGALTGRRRLATLHRESAQGGKALLTRRDQSVSIARALNFPAKLVSHEHSSGNRSDTGSVSAELELKRRKSSQGLGDRPGLRIGSEFPADLSSAINDKTVAIGAKPRRSNSAILLNHDNVNMDNVNMIGNFNL